MFLLSLDGCDHLEAIRRFSNPEPVAGGTVIGVALVGITICPHMFMSGRRGDLNIRGAFLHMAADAGYRGRPCRRHYATDWLWFDPVVSLIIVAVVVVGRGSSFEIL